MQLALVRVMKARNTLMVNQLIAESTEQLSKYFVPEVIYSFLRLFIVAVTSLVFSFLIFL